MDLPGLAEIAKTYGPWGLAVLALGWAAWSLKGDLAKCFQERVTDWKAVSEVVQSFTLALTQFTATTDARNRAQEAMAQALQVQANEIKELRGEVTRLHEAARAALAQRG